LPAIKGYPLFAGALEIAQLWAPGRLARVIDWVAGVCRRLDRASLAAIVRAAGWMKLKAP
jgi:VanZ family protein